MRNGLRTLLVLPVIAGGLALGAPAANAQWHHGGYYGHPHYYHRGPGIGGALVGGLVGGVVAGAVGASIANSYGPPPPRPVYVAPPPTVVYAAPPVVYAAPGYGYGYRGY